MTRTVWSVVTPCGTQAILSLFGTLSSSSCTRKPSAKPSTHPRQVASRSMRAESLFPSLSMLEQTSKKSRPDLLISGCLGVLFGEVPTGKQTRKIPSSIGTRSRRTATSHQSRDSTSDSGYYQQSETPADPRAPSVIPTVAEGSLFSLCSGCACLRRWLTFRRSLS